MGHEKLFWISSSYHFFPAIVFLVIPTISHNALATVGGTNLNSAEVLYVGATSYIIWTGSSEHDGLMLMLHTGK
jgi:hypothetical protein